MKEIIQKNFAERLKYLMQEKGLSISSLSRAVGIPISSINGWTLMKRSIQIDSLYKLADYFGVTIDYLVGRED